MAKAKRSGGTVKASKKRRRNKKSEFRWTVAREQAALLVADDVKTVKEIAAAVGVTEFAVYKWKTYPAFNKRVDDITNKLAAKALRFDIAKTEERVRHLDKYWKKLDRVVEQRANDPELKAAPGGDTGLLVRQRRIIGTGKKAKEILEYEADIPLVRELREHLKHAAQELGQWQEDRAPAEAVIYPIEFVEIYRAPPPEVIDARPAEPAAAGGTAVPPAGAIDLGAAFDSVHSEGG